MTTKNKAIVHERVALARRGNNPALIMKMRSGWAVLGDDQTIPGYCVLLADPVVDNLNMLEWEERDQFLLDMTLIGDALLNISGADRINYSILNNSAAGLHAHIHPRYASEIDAFRNSPPWKYRFMDAPATSFNYRKDRKLIATIKTEIEHLYNKHKQLH